MEWISSNSAVDIKWWDEGFIPKRIRCRSFTTQVEHIWGFFYVELVTVAMETQGKGGGGRDLNVFWITYLQNFSHGHSEFSIIQVTNPHLLNI